MSQDQSANSRPKKPQTREERLKAALKSNMGRRKAQARARSDAQTQEGKGPAQEGEQ